MKRTPLFMAILSVLFLLSGCGRSSEIQYSDTVGMIIKEESVAGIKLNDTADDVENLLGSPESESVVMTDDEGTLYKSWLYGYTEHSEPLLTVGFYKSDGGWLVRKIETVSADYPLSTGLRCSSKEEDIGEYYDGPSVSEFESVLNDAAIITKEYSLTEHGDGLRIYVNDDTVTRISLSFNAPVFHDI